MQKNEEMKVEQTGFYCQIAENIRYVFTDAADCVSVCREAFLW